MKNYLLIFIFSCCVMKGIAQKTLHIFKTSEKITIDGILDEKVWQTADKANQFQQTYPGDTALSKTKTTVLTTYDDNFIYIAAICYDSLPNKKYVIQSLKRDFSFPVSDAFAIFIDPFNDKVNGFSFSVSPLGVQREGLLQGGGSFGVTTSWDNKWFSAVHHYNDKWTVEMKIPFKTIRYNDKITTWGINFARNNLKINETSVWNPVPRQYNVASLAFTGKLIWDKPPKKAGTNVAIIPYLIGSTNKNFQYNTNNSKFNGGFDAKIAVTSSLNLDLTVNPDFSQVEVDRQITNLSRFSLFFPEKRQFFIENSDLFARFGFRQIRPFFSRKIGLNNGNSIPILAGARLSGKINNNWRIGLMNMQTEGVPKTTASEAIKAENYSVAAIQRTIGKRSSLDGIFVNRQGIINKNADYADYNRIIGVDYNLRLDNNKWLGKAFYHHSFSPNIKGNDYAHATWLMYNTEKITAQWNHEYVGENYRADVGFVPRVSQYNTNTNKYVYLSYWRFEPSIDYRFYPKSKTIQNYQIGTHLSEYLNENYQESERSLDANFTINFISQSKLRLKIYNNNVLLNFPTDITFAGNTPLDSGEYLFNNATIAYNSSKFKTFSYKISGDYGNYYIGKKLTTSASVNYRVQPWGKFGLKLNQDKIWLPDGYSDVSIWLIGPKLEFTFTKKLFFTTFIQYNTQIDNVNINARLQYRFKPMSDLFIVYTDNYNSPNLSIKNRALVVKLIYWLNI